MTHSLTQMRSALTRLSLSLVILATAILCTSPINADDEPVATPDPFTVRDAGVYLLSAYGTNLNDRGLFKSTLPGYTLSRRPSASRSDANTPTPLSLITFSGSPAEDIDVLLEFDNGRFLSHWPPARMRSKRLLWASLNTSIDAPEVPARMADGHWLSPLREDERLFAMCRGRCDRGLIYDAELKYSPHVTLERDGEGFRVQNKGDFPVHDVHVYRPTGDGQWSVWSVASVGAVKKVKKSDKEGDSEAGEESAEAVFDDAGDEGSDSKEDGTDDDNSADGTEAKSTEVAESTAEEAEASEPSESATTGKGGLAGFIAKVKSGELPSTPKKEDEDSVAAVADPVGVVTVDEALQSWTQRLHDQGMGDVESNHITTILKSQALRTDATMLVYRMDESQLEKLLPMEVTPYPDRLYRVAIVIVQDADPDLQSRIEALVKQLGDDAWPQRVAAQEELAELGLAAKPKLEEAIKSDDAEVVFRAEQLLELMQTTP
ncbi:MAG: hypothetical protein KDA93_18785 [Planctomycetaceae bacterium]|nr:hypothetical protein [Planctomycetaceae bacterium]